MHCVSNGAMGRYLAILAVLGCGNPVSVNTAAARGAGSSEVPSHPNDCATALDKFPGHAGYPC